MLGILNQIGSHTNRNIWIELLREENTERTDVSIENGKTKKKKVWECEYETTTKLKRSDVGFVFNVYVREGNGQIRLWKFTKTKKKKIIKR